MPIISLKSVGKKFNGVSALENINLAFESQAIHCVVGENGAGKSTLMKILIGEFQDYEGEIFFEGSAVRLNHPRKALKLGIGMIHQELTLLPNRSIAQNIVLGREPIGLRGLIDTKAMHKTAEFYLSKLGLSLDPAQNISALPIALRQMVEIAKSLSLNARVLILDEPTSSLSENETKTLLSVLKTLREEGIALIYISHRLEEVFELSDTITILRDGQLISSRPSYTEDEVVRLMVGREVKQLYQKTALPQENTLLTVNGLSGAGFSNISLRLHKGEVVGISGLVGAGRSEFARALVGIDAISAGSISFGGKEYTRLSIQKSIQNGIVYVPEDRKDQGLFLGLNMRKNVTINILKKHSRFGFLRLRELKQKAHSFIEQLSIRPPDLSKRCKNFSGGNQQKLVIAKWLSVQPRVLILDEPTRGIDVGARAEIYALIDRLASEGIGILVISSELPEILGLSDRIYVMRGGGITGVLSRQEADQTKIMHLSAGTSQ